MANTPRPVVIRFRLGKGLVKARQESANTSRAIVQQVTLQFADEQFDSAKAVLAEKIQRDVSAELTHMAKLYRRYIIGASGYKSQPTGTLTPLAKGSTRPAATLGSMLPVWEARSLRYLRQKKAGGGGVKWFDNTGWGAEGGYLAMAFAPEGFGGIYGDGGSIFSEMFGGVSVRILRNKAGTGTNSGTIAFGAGPRLNTQLATIQVRALGNIQRSMLSTTGGYNSGLMSLVRAYDPKIAHRLGGPKGRYRPSLEPFLKFFLEQSIPHAITARVASGGIGTIFRS